MDGILHLPQPCFEVEIRRGIIDRITADDNQRIHLPVVHVGHKICHRLDVLDDLAPRDIAHGASDVAQCLIHQMTQQMDFGGLIGADCDDRLTMMRFQITQGVFEFGEHMRREDRLPCFRSFKSPQIFVVQNPSGQPGRHRPDVSRANSFTLIGVGSGETESAFKHVETTHGLIGIHRPAGGGKIADVLRCRGMHTEEITVQ